METEGRANISDVCYQDQLLNYEDEEKLPTLDEYLQNQPNPSENVNQFEIQDFAYIHFLDSRNRPYHTLSVGQFLNFLTGSNKNYMQTSLVQNPLPNQNLFFASSLGGNNKITHHAFIN